MLASIAVMNVALRMLTRSLVFGRWLLAFSQGPRTEDEEPLLRICRLIRLHRQVIQHVEIRVQIRVLIQPL